MNKKTVMILIIVLLAVGIFIGIKNYLNTKANSNNVALIPFPTVEQKAATAKIAIKPSPTMTLPTPPPLSRVIKRIDDNLIIITDKDMGETQLQKNPANVKVFKRISDTLIPATFADLQVGQRVTINIVPRVSAEIIIEP